MKTWKEMKEVQPLASQIILNSIQKDRISHAYLIQGKRGTGKEDMATLLAKEIFCIDKVDGTPCQECINCKRIESGNHPDVHWIKPDGQSIKIEQIKNLQEEFFYSGLESNQKVYIISSAETLTLNASNRILKFLEEPRKHTTAILLTENIQSIIPTIQSRCQIIDLQPLNPLKLQQQLMTHNISEKNAILLSTLTNNLEEAILWNQDDWFAQSRKKVLQLIDTYTSNSADVFLFIHKHWMPHFKERVEQERGLDLLLIAFKDILYYHIGNKKSLVFFSLDNAIFKRAMIKFSEERLLDILNSILKAKRKLKQNVNPTLVMEQLALYIQKGEMI